MPGDKPIFGWEGAFEHTRGVCVVEGPVDLLALRLWGVPGVALVGNRLRHESLVQLERFERLYVALDPDAGGANGTQALVAHFGSRALPIELPGGRDVAELATRDDGKEQFAAAILRAVAGTPTPQEERLAKSWLDSASPNRQSEYEACP